VTFVYLFVSSPVNDLLVSVQDRGYKTLIMIGDGATDLEVYHLIMPLIHLSQQYRYDKYVSF
jgi:hypothetical protein